MSPDLTAARDDAPRAVAAGYVLERELGQGGMATVFLAHDRKHDRPVAVKVLHAELAALLGPDRFLQEIRVTATLHHPHVLALIDSGVFGADAGALAGRPFYVTPYVAGGTLRARLERERALPVDEAVRLATEVAGALDHAHRRGIVHRDVKPENVLLQEGSALVADFGVALALAEAGSARLTLTGLALGTPQYMSPEQAAGERHIGPRSDVYALGAMLYEMLAGEAPFTGPSAPAVIARVLTEPPRPLAERRPTVPPHVEAAVQRALAKLPADRFATAGELARALTAGAGPGAGDVSGGMRAATTLPGAAVRPGARARRLAPFAVAAVGVAAGIAGWLRPTGRPGAVPPIRSTLLPPPGEEFAGGGGLALSPDGTRLAFTVLRDPARPRLFVRTLATGAVRELAGTAGADRPFWSPDGRSLAFFAAGTLRVVAADGGPVSTVARAAGGRGGAWGPDDTILFASDSGGVIYRVAAAGGPVTAVTRRGREGPHERPAFLPDGRRFVFSGALRSGVFVGDLRTRAQTLLRADAGGASYAAPGYLLVEPAGTLAFARLLAQRFDPARGTLAGPTTLVADSVATPDGVAAYAVSANGLLVYQQQQPPPARVWHDRQGTPLDSIPHDDGWTFRISHDGTRVVQAGLGLWVRDLRRGVALRLSTTGDPERDVYWGAVWSPDDARLAFINPRLNEPPGEIRVLRADATGGEERFPTPPGGGSPVDWSPDGRTLLLIGAAQSDPQLPALWRLDLATRALRQWLTLPTSLPGARFSPDGRAVAYQSDETGSSEVYVRPFPGPGAPVRVSTAGGGQPVWRGDGRELFYLSPGGDLMAAAVTPASATRPSDVGAPRLLARAVVRDPFAPTVTPYDVAPDGQRFLLSTTRRAAGAPLTLLAPWSGAAALPAR